MNKTKNQRLAEEMTQFCKQRVKKNDALSKAAKPILQASLIAMLSVLFNIAPDGPIRRAW